MYYYEIVLMKHGKPMHWENSKDLFVTDIVCRQYAEETCYKLNAKQQCEYRYIIHQQQSHEIYWGDV
jgi:hypothetical protein